MLVVVFTTQEKGSPLPEMKSTSDEEWDSLLKRCDEALPQPISRNIYIDGMVRIVNDTEIIIIKRNEQRFWTRSIAREDAEATLLQAMYLKKPNRDKVVNGSSPNFRVEYLGKIQAENL